MLNILRDSVFAVFWIRNGFIGGRPKAIKNKVLARYGQVDGTWIETGTYKGETTRFLAGFGMQVHTLEPESNLYSAAVSSLAHLPNVKVHFGTSEELLPNILAQVSTNCNFWLDGHYSGGKTFKGTVDFPLLEELSSIAKECMDGRSLTVFVDDVCCLSPIYEETFKVNLLDYLVDWARQHKLVWTIENDIFIMRSQSDGSDVT